MKRFISILCIMVLMCLLSACSTDAGKVADAGDGSEEGSGLTSQEEGESTGDTDIMVDINNENIDEYSEEKPVKEACWTVYWDDEDYMDKLGKSGENYDIICIFEAYLDGDHRFVLDQAALDQYEKIKSGYSPDQKFYLTFVNDVVKDGSSSQKDTDALYDVLSDPEGHAEEIVDMAVANGFDGIEIDYEKIRKDLKLWELFITFENELIRKASDAGLGLRVLLEPSTPVADIELPKGPEYVLMCYNLFGYGTDPGPKADRAFLEGLVKDFNSLSPDLGFALANGGFDWNLSEGSITALTDLTGRELAASVRSSDMKRDEDSGVVHFTYEKDGKKHEVWLADDETIRFWTGILDEAAGEKVRISLWRI